jgi:hypothetical protein
VTRRASVVMLLTLASACATDPGADTTGESESGSEAATETGEDTMDGHGSVRIEIVPLGGDTSIFDGTTEVVATVHYESCLQDFYLSTNPEFAKDGPDGAPIFGAWVDKLCADFAGSPVCSVVEIGQTLLPDNAVFSLRVSYAIADAASLSDSELHVGPLPTTELAGCEASVELQQSGLIGRDADGVDIWRISTLPASNRATTDQGAPLRVEVIRNDPP